LIKIFNCSVDTRDHKVRSYYISLKNIQGWTPLIIASFHGFPKIVSLLTKHNAIPTIMNSRKETAYEVARTLEIKTMLKEYEIYWHRANFGQMIEEELMVDISVDLSVLRSKNEKVSNKKTD
jgi:ankyrin repeat protein